MARELGIRNVTIFPMTADSPDVTYDSAVPLKWAVSLETKNNYSEKEYKDDMHIEKSSKRLDSVEVTLELSSNTPPSVDAKITGATYNKCKRVTTVGFTPLAIALAYEIVMDDDTVRRRVLYNVGLSRDEQKNDVESDGETYIYSGKAIPLPTTGEVDLLMDQKEVNASEDEGVKTEFKNFFTAPVFNK